MMNVKRLVNKQMYKYSTSWTQKGSFWRIIESRNVPPPIAVIVPTVIPPRASIPPFKATKVPPIVKTAVPK